mmetsp:Transcript_29296/g.32542  ORF Transcript_29296/g.32542 Transcript_29296/m.32542 type:complete len:151 (+) Transcript_29296:91-543(+)|eukprot:CAMPEP_0168523704 /NCGR_PEP_ID=MMETSP0405-20121227/10157_1 /TAXON_ID=498012 /ORGANISM="Trichosphaerium sp, Strain Am-I-7 wt" /LENGTH=150 /DNA_ID=CAMNT_0008545659 /DNA_START=71 /DNA_END=523 /DNA_ORIENTATION=+
MAQADLSKEQIEELKEAFALFDQDGNGMISKEELGKVMKSLGQEPTSEQLDQMINEVDKDNSGTIEFDEFLQLMAKQMTKGDLQDELREAFKAFDQNGDGKISKAELKKVMEGLGENLSDQDISDMIDEADHDGDGEINYEEFVAMMLAK